VGDDDNAVVVAGKMKRLERVDSLLANFASNQHVAGGVAKVSCRVAEIRLEEDRVQGEIGGDEIAGGRGTPM
jgi:hypothetical protein